MSKNKGFESLGSLFDKGKKSPHAKAPAYEWQDLALQVIEKLNVPQHKKSSVFKLCKNKPKVFIERCLSDTEELCESGEQWKYFFKVAGSK